MGRLIRVAADADRDGLEAGLRDEGFIKDRVRIDPDLLLAYLAPFVEPTKVDSFRFTREWMREQFQRINNPREPTYTVALKLNLPPYYLLIHRTWLGGIGVLSQLEAEAPFRAILTEFLPGFARDRLTRSLGRPRPDRTPGRDRAVGARGVDRVRRRGGVPRHAADLGPADLTRVLGSDRHRSCASGRDDGDDRPGPAWRSRGRACRRRCS